MIKNCLLLAILLLYAGQRSYSQHQNIDSLQTIFKSDTTDNIRLEACKKLTSLLVKKDSAQTGTYIQKGIVLATKLDDKESRLYFDFQIARVLLEGQHLEDAMKVCKKVLLKSKKEGYQLLTANCYSLLGNPKLQRNNDSLMLLNLKKALEIYENLQDKKQVAVTISNMGMVYDKQGKFNEALESYNQSLQINKELEDEKATAESYGKLASLYGERGDFENALSFSNLSLKIREKIGDKAGMASVLSNIGLVHSQQEEFAKAMPLYEKSLKLRKEIEDQPGIARVLMQIGILFDRKGDYGKAMTYYEKSLTIYNEVNDKRGIASCQNNMGLVSRKQGNYQTAIQYYNQCLLLMKELGRKKGIGNTLNNLGIAYKNLSDYPKALSYYKSGLEIKKEIGDKKGQTYSLMNVGLCYLRNLQQTDTAFIYFNQAFTICKEMGYEKQLRSFFEAIGDWYTSQGQLPEALDFYFDALRIVEETQDTLGMARTYNALAKVYESQNTIDQALSYRQDALKLYQLLNHTSGIASTKSAIANIFIQTRKYDNALTYASEALQSYQILQDSCQLSNSFLIVGKAYSSLNLTDSAIYYLEKGTERVAKCNSNGALAQGFAELGKIYQTQQNSSKAFTAYQQAFYYAKSSQDRKSIKEAAAYLHPIYRQKGQFQKAYEVLNLYQASKDSLFNHENTRNLVQKEIEYIYAKADQEKTLVQQKDDALNERILERHRWIIYTSVGAFIAMLLMALVVYRNYRNKQKANILLRQQKKELEELDHVKSRLFANISHELRTPLTLINSPIESLINNGESYSPAAMEKLELVKRNSQQLRGLVDDILDLSKLESNKIVLNEEATSLNPFLNRVFSNFDSLTKHLGITYTIQLQDLEDKWALMDTAKVEKVIYNLLSNAIKHTPSGGEVRLTAHLTRQKILLQVTDTGHGIAASDLPLIFDRFFQSKQPDSPIQGGTGIGLALAKELTHLMGGKISVESEKEKGSQFSVELPFDETEAPLEIVFPPEEITEEVSLQHLAITDVTESEKQFSVLIVEDHLDMQQFISSLLKMKYQVHLAFNGKDALKVLSKNKIDLIVSDVMMPEMDGYELLKHLKNSQELCSIPVIMLTALDDKESKLSALTLGVDDYLTKPFSPEELLARAHNLLLRHEARLEAQLEAHQMESNLTLEESPDGELEGVTMYPESEEGQPVHTEETDLEWLEKVTEAIKKELENPDFQVADLANQFNMSERQLYRKMKEVTGMTPKKYQQEVALQKGRYLLERKQYGNVTAICYSVGMSNVSRFSQLYEARFGKKPKEYFGAMVS